VNSAKSNQVLSTNGVNRITAEDSIITTPIERRRPCPSDVGRKSAVNPRSSSALFSRRTS
jgi:hypothetical protein